MDRHEEEMYELGCSFGDPRRCPHHPQVVTSSPDGMFDAPCGACEYECYEHAAKAAWEALSQEERDARLAAFRAAEEAREAAVKAELGDDDIPF